MSRSEAYPKDYKMNTRFSGNANCLEDECQLWNTETKDCGLKHTSVTPVLTEIKSTLEEISQEVDVIRANVE